MKKLSNGQILPSGLWVMGTPIGNQEDLTFRAYQALEKADAILCEDTRRTLLLLKKWSLSLPLFHLQEKSFSQQSEKWIKDILSGKNYILLTDAGTPGLSDPGSFFISLAQKKGVRIVPIPGVSALTTLLSVSGFSETAFVFKGFFPRHLTDQKKELFLARESMLASLFFWFESPKRLLKTLSLIASECPESWICVGKELTKIYEHLFYGSIDTVLKDVSQHCGDSGCRGEWSLGVSFLNKKKFIFKDKEAECIKALECFQGFLDSSDSKKIITRLSEHYDVPKKKIYSYIHQQSSFFKNKNIEPSWCDEQEKGES